MPRKTKEGMFEKKAKRILSYLKTDKRYDRRFFPRPFFIEFTGSPDAGKTTTIRELYNFLRRYGFTVGIPQEGAEIVQHIPRNTPEYNFRTGLYALQLLMDEGWRCNYDVVILDRGIFDAYCWMLYWYDKKHLSKKRMEEAQNLFLHPLWVNRIDIAYFVTCDAPTAMERNLRISATSRLGDSTNPVSIQKSIKRHRLAFDLLHTTYPQLHFINTTKLSEEQMIETFTALTLDILEKRAQQLKLKK